jgi:hypothetical protein
MLGSERRPVSEATAQDERRSFPEVLQENIQLQSPISELRAQDERRSFPYMELRRSTQLQSHVSELIRVQDWSFPFELSSAEMRDTAASADLPNSPDNRRSFPTLELPSSQIEDGERRSLPAYDGGRRSFPTLQ